jgi:hypothetical protein
MPQAFVCPNCGARYSPSVGRGKVCPICSRGGVPCQPVVYWRIVAVAMGIATLLVLTLIFGLKARAEVRRSPAPQPGLRRSLVRY